MSIDTSLDLEKSMWYHATTLSGWKNICRNGILAEHNKDQSDSLDFGYGFYLTPSENKAKDFIRNAIAAFLATEKDDFDTRKAVIIGFEFCPLEWFEGETYSTRLFGDFDDEFALFVFENRTTNIRGSNQHSHDAICGPMATGEPLKTIIEYFLGIITEEQAINRLKTPTDFTQLSLHTQQLCDIIIPKVAYIYDFDTGERLELDVNEYKVGCSVS